MSTLSRIEAAHRSEVVELQALSIDLDLSQAADVGIVSFPVESRFDLRVKQSELFVDFAGQVLSVQGPDGLRWQARDERIYLENLPVDSDFTLVIAGRAKYSRTGEGLHRSFDPVDQEVYLYTHCEPNDAHRYFPCFDQPDLKVPVTWHITAPAAWQVRCNGALAQRQEAGGLQHLSFEPTLPLPPYLCAMFAGPYVHTTDVYQRPDGSQVPLAVWCRASRVEDFDPEEILAITKSGLAFFETKFDLRYPWGKYDQVFVPEYNIGAMENPGCVTFNEDAFVFTGLPTLDRRARRADTILHEMSHMWFGDLVTPRWWDDLWLKESFADYCGHAGTDGATEFENTWAYTTVARKEWAYRADQYPTTHPILADIEDVQAAKQNFDGITYSKGAAVLAQLVARLGEETFWKAAHSFFEANAHGAASLPDFLTALQGHTSDDMQAWAQAWLATSGPSEIRLELQYGEASHSEQASLAGGGAGFSTLTGRPVIRSARLYQQNRDRSGSSQGVIRPHTLGIGLYDFGPGASVYRRSHLRVRLDEASQEVPELLGEAQADFVIVNDEDLTYAVVIADEHTTEALLRHLGKLPSAGVRALAWSQLWNALRDGRLAPADFLGAALTQIPGESFEPMVVSVLDNAFHTLRRYLPAAERPAWIMALARMSFDQALQAAAQGKPIGRIRAFVNATLRILGLYQSPAGVLDDPNLAQAQAMIERIWRGEVLEVDRSLRWACLSAQAPLGLLQEGDLEEAARLDNSVAGQNTRLKIELQLAGRTSGEQIIAKSRSASLSNNELEAVVEAFDSPERAVQGEDWVGPYLEEVQVQWDSRSQVMAEIWIRGMFPHWAAQAEEIEKIRVWLEGDRPRPVARLVREALDELQRSERLGRIASAKVYPSPPCFNTMDEVKGQS